MLQDISKAIGEDIERLDAINLQAGDALDAKASFVLVVITLLAALSTQILILQGLPCPIRAFQVIAVVGIILGVVFSISALWPADFKIPPVPEDWEDFVVKFQAERRAELEKEHRTLSDAEVLKEFEAARRRVALKRIAANKQIVEKKARFNDRAFYATVITIVMQVLTLVWLARLHL